MMKIGKEEEKLIKVTAVVLGFTLLFMFFVYIPKSKEFAKLKLKVERNDALVTEIKRLIGENTSLEEGIKVLRREANFLNAKFIDQKDLFIALNRISEAADRAGVRVISVSPQALAVFTKGNTTPKYYDKACLKQQVRVSLEGRFEQLTNYLILLEKSPVGIFTVDGFTITRGSERGADLKMDATIGLYIFGDENTVRKL